MTMAKYTPGPWVREIMPAPSGKMLDYVHATYSDGRPADEIAAITSENYADANLIAAAPDLYDALAAYVAWMDFKGDAVEEHEMFERADALARAALAKARGDSTEAAPPASE
jgi:ribonuclease HI